MESLKLEWNAYHTRKRIIILFYLFTNSEVYSFHCVAVKCGIFSVEMYG